MGARSLSVGTSRRQMSGCRRSMVTMGPLIGTSMYLRSMLGFSGALDEVGLHRPVHANIVARCALESVASWVCCGRWGVVRAAAQYILLMSNR